MTTESRVDFELDEPPHEMPPLLHVVESGNEETDVSEPKLAERSELYSKIGTVSEISNVRGTDIIIRSDDTIVLRRGEIVLTDDRLFVFNALLKNLGKPLRAEELRREGFNDRENLSRTRDAFERAISQLKSETEAKSNADIIVKQGVTKGTRYHIPDTVSISDKRKPEVKDQSEYVRRNRIVKELAARYHDHPYVLGRLQQYENPDFKPPQLDRDEIGTYTAYLGKYRLLTALEEVELFTDIDNGIIAYDEGRVGSEEYPSDEVLDLVAARQIAFNTNTRLAFKLAMKKWRYKGTMSEMDVVHEANFGLSQAIARMDVHKGYKFSTYATHWINQATSRALAIQSREIRIPVHVHEKFIKVSGILHKKAAELDRQLTEAEICEYTGMNISDYYDLMRRGKLNLVSLNMPVDDSHETELGDLVPLKEVSDGDTIHSVESRETLVSIFEASTLTDREKFVIGMRYGLGDFYDSKFDLKNRVGKAINAPGLLEANEGVEVTLQDIATLLQISSERVRQLESQGLNKLRAIAEKSEY